jgi:hypothetical protein
MVAQCRDLPEREVAGLAEGFVRHEEVAREAERLEERRDEARMRGVSAQEREGNVRPFLTHRRAPKEFAQRCDASAIRDALEQIAQGRQAHAVAGKAQTSPGPGNHVLEGEHGTGWIHSPRVP